MNKINELVEKINKARNDYYNGVSQVSDKIYDVWIDELSQLDPKNPAVIGIGAEPVSQWEKYTHLSPMGSLNKVQTNDEYKNWHNKYIGKDDDIFLTLKLDGISVSIIYENGVLTKGVTRGSGKIGDLISPNVAKMIGVPLRLNKKIDLTVRGEILLSKSNHEKYFPEYSNPRNAASGISRRYDGEGCDKLTVLTYMLHSDDLECKTQEDIFNTLISLGFMVPTFYVLKSCDDVLKLKNNYQSSLRDQYDFLLDGLVVHNNNLAKQEVFGELNGRPYSSIAVKFNALAKEATISDIEVYVGNSGRLTPVAIFNPKVDLLGAMVERASLHNFGNIEELGVDIGCKVIVCRSNDVIPYIEEVSEPTGTTFNPPVVCPVCGSVVYKNGEYLQCPNRSGCPSQISGKIKNYIRELNILEWGTSLIDRLVESEKVKSIADLYKLSVSDLASIDRMGEKSAEKCYKLLWENNEITLDKFLGGLSIPMIGSSTIRQIMNAGCDTLEKFGQLKAEHFEMVDGVGPTKAASLAKGLEENKNLIFALLNNGVKIKKPIVGVLSGVSICFTGKSNLKRSILEKMAADAGASVKSSVCKDLNMLVIADINSTSSKANAARKNGTKLISEEEFILKCQENPSL